MEEDMKRKDVNQSISVENVLNINGARYSFFLNKPLSVQNSINCYPEDALPKSSNVFGLPHPSFKRAKDSGAYRVDLGHSVNCSPITLWPHEVPQWENVYHLLDLNEYPPTNWSWNTHFGFVPAILLTIEVDLAENVTPDRYPAMKKHNKDKIATKKHLIEAIDRVKLEYNLQYEEILSFCKCILIRFSFEGNTIGSSDHDLGHLSLDAAEYIHQHCGSNIVAVQAPSVDRVDCPGCNVHRILFGLKKYNEKKGNDSDDKHDVDESSHVIIGENFTFSPDISDGCYIFHAHGVSLVGQDVTISTSSLYAISKIK